MNCGDATLLPARDLRIGFGDRYRREWQIPEPRSHGVGNFTMNRGLITVARRPALHRWSDDLPASFERQHRCFLVAHFAKLRTDTSPD